MDPGASQKPSLKPLLEDASATPADGATAMETSSAHAHTDHVKIPSKKGHKGTRRVSFTPQKARELRQKLKGTLLYRASMKG
ncbi:hypothetical protein GOP47_0015486 [Adiantum capillus-veneris]|uniref:Uncharacterized protein n=1 Tax=Adiantum capillus-veneris TaxID=13818 RepID=A0A9D4UJV9_ADICA|nr:hypothetical protein GOP47_0015486 [Adiantum capillus-veneris]